MASATRYAVFFAPSPDSALWHFGSSVLGYDAATALDVEQFVPSGVARDEWRGLTEAPRCYGFHATLKAPFRLAEGLSESDLLAEVERFAASTKPFEVPLEVARLDAFIALVAPSAPAALAALERAVVVRFDRLRAPLNEAEIARRARASLTQRQRALLDEFGYPYVLDEFRFHMSLTGPLPLQDTEGVVASLVDSFVALGAGRATINRLAVFREDAGQFRVLSAFDFP